MIAARDRLIAALDVPNAAAVLPLPDAVADHVRMFNIAEDPDYFQLRERDDGDTWFICSDPYPDTTGWSRIANGAVQTSEPSGFERN